MLEATVSMPGVTRSGGGLTAQSASIFYHLGILYARLNRAAEADVALNKALALDPDGFYGGLALQALARLTPAAP